MSQVSLPGAPRWWVFSTLSGVSWVTDSDTARGGREGERASIAGVSAMSRVVRFTGFATVSRRGWNHGHLHNWRDKVAGSTATAVKVPVAAGTTLAVRSVWCVLPPLKLPSSLGLQVQPMLLGVWDYKHHLHCSMVPPPLGGPVHPPLDIRCAGFSHDLVCWAQVPLLSYGCFTRCG